MNIYPWYPTNKITLSMVLRSIQWRGLAIRIREEEKYDDSCD